jgi:hypothetical protein
MSLCKKNNFGITQLSKFAVPLLGYNIYVIQIVTLYCYCYADTQYNDTHHNG